MYRNLKAVNWARWNHFAEIVVQNRLIPENTGIKFSDRLPLYIRQKSKSRREVVKQY